MFLDVPAVDSHYWQFGSNESIVNVNHAALIMFLLSQLRKAKDIDIFTDVQIICFYAAQTSFLQTICRDAFTDGDVDVDVRTVDSSRDQQKKIVIVDFVRRGPSLGFLSEPTRQCVAFLRAQHARISIGSTQLARHEAGHPANAWEQTLRDFVHHHSSRGAIIRTSVGTVQPGVGRCLREYVTRKRGYVRMKSM